MINSIYDIHYDVSLDSFLTKNLIDTFKDLENKSLDLDLLGNIMSSNPSLNVAAKGGNGWSSDLWVKVKNELYTFFCEKSEKYASLEKELSAKTTDASSVIIPIISVFLAKEFNILSGVILPFIILFFKISLKITKESFCAYWKERLV